MVAVLLNHIKRFRQIKHVFSGTGGVYVILILGLVSGLSFLLTGGLVPQIERNPENPEFVEILVDLTPVAQQNLQMRNIQAVPTPTATPTPIGTTPTGSPSASPSPSTTPPLACFDNTAIAILVDVSGSMADNASAGSNERKIDVLKRALSTFLTNVSPETIVGLFGFATDNAVLVPFGTYSTNAQALTQQISSLEPGMLRQSTNTADGLSLVYNNLIQAKQQYPQDTFSLVFFTDGVPENATCEFVDSSEEYHADNGDGPICASSFVTHPQYPVPVASAIKGLGVNLFTVAVYKEPPYSPTIQGSLVGMMQDTASNPDSTFYIGLPNAQNLETAYSAIADRICQ